MTHGRTLSNEDKTLERAVKKQKAESVIDRINLFLDDRISAIFIGKVDMGACYRIFLS